MADDDTVTLPHAVVTQVEEALLHILSEYMHWVKPQREADGWPDGGPHWQEAEAALKALKEARK